MNDAGAQTQRRTSRDFKAMLVAIPGVIVGLQHLLLPVDWAKNGSLLVLIALVLCAGVIDARIQRIPNRICLAILVSGLANAAFITDWNLLGGFAESSNSLALTGAISGTLGMLALGIIAAITTDIGFGDVKLASALGAWFGFWPALAIACTAFVLAATLVSCIWILGFGLSKRSQAEGVDGESNAKVAGTPLAPQFAIATVLVAFDLQRLIVL